MTNIVPFSFESHEVRVVIIDNEPWFIATDVAKVLEHSNTSVMLQMLDEDEKGVSNVYTLGGNQELAIISESGLYHAVIKSRKPQAKPFRKWVTSEVLPSIRKSGQYSVQQAPVQHSQPQQPTLSEIDTVFAGLIKLGIKPELIESAKLSAIAKSIPHLASVCEESKRLVSAHMSVPEIPMSPTELGKKIALELGLAKVPSPQKVNQALLNAGFQESSVHINKRGEKKIEWHLTEKGQDYGQMQMDTTRGHGKTVFRIKWFSSVICVIEEQFTNLTVSGKK
ncbi:MAG: BRO family protein [Scytonema sp. PMC 1069.18]|nr:BRO family protein [Scytonema sp. PMC 1069.18]MEC4887723.1 BRO family protein [Scytonema sp. PMC 1070.18]